MSLPQQEEDVTRSMNDTTMPPPPARKSKTTRATTGSSSGSTKTSKNPRRKYGMRKGFGMQDWNRLVKSAKNLAQRNGGLRRITRDEVRQHNTEHDGWTILHGKVYNIAPYLHYHPGGLKILKQCLGRDATALFEKYHRWVNADGLIGTLLLGYLDTSRSQDDDDDDDDRKSRSYLPQKTVDGFAVPAPRPPTCRPVPKMLGSDDKSNDDEKDEDPLGL